MFDSYQAIAARRENECGERASYFDHRLRFFSRTNWVTLLAPSLVGVVAGSALFAQANAGLLGSVTLVVAQLTAVHKGLNCDAHQAECRRLVQAYRGLETRYRTVAEVENPNGEDALR